MDTERLECDLVMRGGITSVIVYPKAIAKLAKNYKFRCVGGTSAGAIAATATAAGALGVRKGPLPGLLRGTARRAGQGDRREDRAVAGLPTGQGP